MLKLNEKFTRYEYHIRDKAHLFHQRPWWVNLVVMLLQRTFSIASHHPVVDT